MAEWEVTSHIARVCSRYSVRVSLTSYSVRLTHLRRKTHRHFLRSRLCRQLDEKKPFDPKFKGPIEWSERSCRDVWMILVYIAFWVGLVRSWHFTSLPVLHCANAHCMDDGVRCASVGGVDVQCNVPLRWRCGALRETRGGGH
jgi:hypothetical protein